MKTAAAVFSICAVTFVFSDSGFAKNRSPKKHQPDQRAQQAPPPPPVGSRAPSAELGDFFAAYLDRILAPLDQQIPLPRNNVTQLRESFADRSSKCPPNEKPAYEAAVRVCNAVWQAMDEREKAVASLQGSAAVHGASDLGAHRKDNPSSLEYERERHEERNRKHEAAQNDAFLITQLKTNWTQRTIQLRQTINQVYAREREAERPVQQTAGTAPAASANTITLDKPIQVKIKYGTATIPAGTTVTVVSRDANGVVVDYAGEQVRLPP